MFLEPRDFTEYHFVNALSIPHTFGMLLNAPSLDRAGCPGEASPATQLVDPAKNRNVCPKYATGILNSKKRTTARVGPNFHAESEFEVRLV